MTQSAILENLAGLERLAQQWSAYITEITAPLVSVEMLLGRDVRADFEAYRRAHPTVDPVVLARAFEGFVAKYGRVPA